MGGDDVGVGGKTCVSVCVEGWVKVVFLVSGMRLSGGCFVWRLWLGGAGSGAGGGGVVAVMCVSSSRSSLVLVTVVVAIVKTEVMAVG